MHYLTFNQALEIYRRIGLQSGGAMGILNLGGLKSALAQPYMTFDSEELYPTLIEKATAIGFSVIQNHPFVDGNKRAGHAMMAMFLELNGYEIKATVNEQVTAQEGGNYFEFVGDRIAHKLMEHCDGLKVWIE